MSDDGAETDDPTASPAGAEAPPDGDETPPDPVAAADRGLAGRVRLVVAAVAVVGLLLRVVDLGGRVLHWDEGRVGYWTLRFQETGEFFYRPIIHGPFLPVVNRSLFDLFSASPTVARLPVALLGGLLPLSALALRGRLSDRETVALAVLLAVDPLLLYYSRFMRSDVVVATFAFTAFVLCVAAIDRRNGLYVIPAAAAIGLAFTAKENALVYVLCLGGAAALMLDHRLVAVATRTGSLLDAVVDTAVAGLRTVDDWTAGKRLRGAVRRRVDRDTTAVAVHVAVWLPVVAVVAAGAFLTAVVAFYAPRPELWQALAGEQPLGPVLETATFGAGERFVDSWVSAGEGNPYLAFLWDLSKTVGYGSTVVVSLAAVGFLADGYGGRNRRLVAFCVYWAAVSLLGYPVGTDIQAPWIAVHVVLPLCVPGAVGLVAVVDRLESGLSADDGVRVGLAAFVLVAAAGGLVVPTVDYWNTTASEDQALIQWAQPSNDLGDTLADVQTVARHNDGTDVLYVGTTQRNGNELFYVGNESALDRAPPAGNWHSRLPLPWYTERVDANVTSTPASARYDGLPADPPPVVIAYAWDHENVSTRLPAGYEAHRHDFKLWGEEVVVYVESSVLEEAQAAASVEARVES
ncbi:flippase activity-associated protein Agl23 [Halobaculum sp. MBLA0143]|uniref:flippase activity-associated protein Agl23 n=1 Tax=Halobaculum sp. MBLA0143 TaxID=3079933 RepID=UPI003524D669